MSLVFTQPVPGRLPVVIAATRTPDRGEEVPDAHTPVLWRGNRTSFPTAYLKPIGGHA